jgi:phenylalanyl-tRNA synthetase beta chain
MRSTLLGSLVDSLRFNLNRRQTRVRLFELSRIFLPAGDGFHQPQRLGAVAFGPAIPEQWGEATRNVDYFDVLADVEALLAPRSAQFQPCTHPALHPGKCAEILLDGRPVGWIGELHPQLLGKYDVAGAVVAFEIELEAIGARSLPAYQEVSKFPPVLRDIAVIVDAGVPVATLLDALRRHKATFVEHVAVFDVYRGKGIEEGKKGLAFRVLLQDTQKTLTEAEVDAAVADLRQVLVQEYGAKLRQ